MAATRKDVTRMFECVLEGVHECSVESANSVDLDQNACLYQGLHCLIRNIFCNIYSSPVHVFNGRICTRVSPVSS